MMHGQNHFKFIILDVPNSLSLCINVSKIKHTILLFSVVSHKLSIIGEDGLRHKKDGCKTVECVVVCN